MKNDAVSPRELNNKRLNNNGTSSKEGNGNITDIRKY